ncbi:hypothetical protein AB0O76_23285, partial [Streptomyces sp. NPDC086554]
AHITHTHSCPPYPRRLAPTEKSGRGDGLVVSQRTVWRWLAVAGQSGRTEPVARQGGFVFTDEWWARLEQLGGNVAEWHRQLTRDQSPAVLGRLPSLATMHRALREHLRAGRG